MKTGTVLHVALVLITLLLPAGAGAAELCLENTLNSDYYYRLSYVQQESVYAVNGFLAAGTAPKVATQGTAFLQKDRSLVISLTTTYPNYYTHPQCTDLLTFAPGKFLVASVEGTCFGSTTEPNKQYAGTTYVRVPCP